MVSSEASDGKRGFAARIVGIALAGVLGASLAGCDEGEPGGDRQAEAEMASSPAPAPQEPAAGPEAEPEQERAPAEAPTVGAPHADAERAEEPPEPEAEPEDWWDPVTERGQKAHGLYITGPYARIKGARGVIQLVRANRMDSIVLDLKDAQGRVHYDTAIPELAESETRRFGVDRELIQEIKDAGIYVIGRVVCFSDPQLPARMPERSIQYNVPRKLGRPWISWGTGHTWLDPYNQANHDMVLALVAEAQELGVEEVQLDYIRFPVDDGTPYAMYPAQRDTPRPELLLGLLRRMDETLSIPLGVDVFGLTAWRRGDPSGLGQDLEAWTKHVEVYTPMLYPNSMRNWQRGQPDRARQLILSGVDTLRGRVGPRPVIRPFLQAFEQGSDEWTPRFIAQQIEGARRGRADGFLFWHPGSNFGMVRRGMAGPARGLAPFPVAGDLVALRTEPGSP